MRFKIPCKKFRIPGFVALVVSCLLLVAPMSAAADSGADMDRALFWSIQKGGQPAGNLLGTIHSEDPRVLDFSESLLSNLKDNGIFAMELVPDLSTLARLTEHMHYPPGQTLLSVIGEQRFQRLETALSAYKVPPEFISRMKPWAAMMTLSTPPPKTGFFMDMSLSLRAAGSGLKVVGLETLEQQLSFLQEMPMAMQISLLDQAIAEYGQVVAAHDEMVDTYLQNDLPSLQTLSGEQLQQVGKEASDYFIEAGINARNHRMLESLLGHLAHDRVFIAVGALHLPGKDGLINLLRRNGFVLTPLDLPLRKEPGAATQ